MTDYNHDPVVPRCGLAAALAGAAAFPNELLWTTDTMNLYVEQGGSKILVGGNSGVTCATALVAGYVPYCTTAPNVVDDSPIWTDATNVVIGSTTANGKLDVWDGGSAAGLVFDNTGVAHGMTDLAPTTTFMQIGRAHGAYMGGFIRGISIHANQPGLSIYSIIGFTDSNDTIPAILLNGSKRNTTGNQALAAAETVLKIQNYATDLVTVLGSGDTTFVGQVNFTTAHGTTLLIDHIGEHTGAHTTVIDNALTATGGVVTLYNGQNYIGDSANAFMTVGLTINQGAADNEILSFKSSDVAHGITTYAETDTYGLFQKSAALTGGMSLWGFSEAVIGLGPTGLATTTDTTETTQSMGAVTITSVLKSGTGGTTFAADDNILVVANYSATEFIIKGNGDFFYNGTGAAYDAYDDALACQDLSFNLSNQLPKVLKYNKRKLNDMGVIAWTPYDDGREDIFVSRKGMDMLQLGAIGELYRVSQKLCRKMGITFEEAKSLN